MRAHVLVAALMVALSQPSSALGLSELVGAWAGEGTWAAEGEPEQRLRCRLRASAEGAQALRLEGRCATARGGQSFNWMLVNDGGRVIARTIETGPEEAPQAFEGVIAADSIAFPTPGGGLFELRRDARGLTLTLWGQVEAQRVRGEAVLTPAQEP